MKNIFKAPFYILIFLNTLFKKTQAGCDPATPPIDLWCPTFPTNSSTKLSTNPTTPWLEQFLVEIFQNTIFQIAGVIALIAVVYGGALYMTARDDDWQAGKGKNIILTTMGGIIVIFLSYALVKIVLTFDY